MNKILIISCICFFATSHSFCWGPTGHRTTGLIAHKHLNKKAKAKLEALLSGKPLPYFTTWMDEVRSDSNFKFMDDWHWVTIPQSQSYQQTEKNTKGDIIATLERVIQELKVGGLSKAEETQRIKILLHLVGDIHQPLHVGSKPDRGGNDVKVMWFKNESNLHTVWDSDMIDHTKLSFTELAESFKSPSEEEIKKWQSATVQDWASENRRFEEQIYNLGNGKLGYQYAYQNFPVVELRLLQAGVRLAGILNDIYGK